MPYRTGPEIHQRTFDYIIIGGQTMSHTLCGTAGCVLANRLSCQNKVLVLEAGSQVADSLWESRIPGLNGQLRYSEADWDLRSVPQVHAKDRTIEIPLGKVLGGSSAINAMVWHRCSPDDYNGWNVPGWTYEDLKPYFCMAEALIGADSNVDGAVHGTEGPMKVTHQDIGDDAGLGAKFRQACVDCGLTAYKDITDQEEQIGVTGMQASISQGRRSSTSACYLDPLVVARPELEVGLGCHVVRIEFQDKGAYKVVFEQDQQAFEVFLDMEVLLCAGAIHSPHILMRSGVGPAAELAASAIPLVQDLPGVGRNLINHWRVPLVHETHPHMSLHRALFSADLSPYTYYDAWADGKGALTRIWPDAVAYFGLPDVPDSRVSKRTPQFELFAGGLALCHLLPQLKDIDCATLLVVLLAPFSRGSVRLGPGQSVIVDPGLLVDQRDAESLAKAVEYTLSIAGNANYRSCVRRWILAPGQDIRDYVGQYVESIHHYAGTCKMGGHSHADPMTVVDEHLRVVGTHRLRVVDASIFPTLPAGRLHPPAMSEISISLEGQDKVFASIWLSSTQVVVGTKESKLFLLELTHGRAFNIPLIDWDKDDDHGTPDTHSPFVSRLLLKRQQTQISVESRDPLTPTMGVSSRFRLQPRCQGIRCLAMNPSKTLLAVGLAHPAITMVYALPQLQPYGVCKGHQDAVYSVTWLSDSELMTGSRDGTLSVWQAQGETAGDLTRLWTSPKTGTIRDVQSTGGEGVACLTSKGTVQLWDTHTLQEVS
ncbi:hypothetical protein DFQ29_007140 [Apophysomyces sp. BC1021]|nr:hypothetical protein DFQ29_007140 [Apophysomyces sp. BC1021]